MKLKQLLAFIKKETKAGNLNNESLVTFSLPSTYYKDKNKISLGNSISLNLSAGAMVYCGDEKGVPSELNFEPAIREYRSAMKDFNVSIPITA